MILHWDGSAPILFLIVAVCCYIYCEKKNKEYAKKKTDEQKEFDYKLNEIDKLSSLCQKELKEFKKSDFRYLDESDFKHFTRNYGVKFI